MAAPIAITQTGPGASGHNDNVAVGTFSWGATTGDAEDDLFIHLGFVPKIFILKNISINETGANHQYHAVMWFNVMDGTLTHFAAIDLEDGTYLFDDDGIMGWDSSVTGAPAAGQTGGPPGTYGSGVVPAGFYYIKEGVAALSGGFVQDVVIGVKIHGTTPLEGEREYGLLGTDGNEFHYTAIG